jgi:hypothetical protein
MSSQILSFLGGMIGNTGSQIANPATQSMVYTANALMPVMLPSLPELTTSFAFGDINATGFREFALLNGYQFGSLADIFRYTKYEGDKAGLDREAVETPRSINASVMKSSQYMPSIDETKDLLNKKLITSELALHIIGRQTTFNEALSLAHLNNRYEIPGAADLIRFAVRDAFSDEIVNQFEYAKETPTQLYPWMEKQGFGQDLDFQMPANATDAHDRPIAGTAKWFDLYWWSHWELPSPTQGYEMLHRLYPDSSYGPSPFYTETNGFTERDLALLLKSSDYPSYWRERLTAISYHNLNRSDVIPMYERGLIRHEEVYHALRADGYRDAEALKLLDFADYRRNLYLGADPAKLGVKAICSLFQAGMLTERQVQEKMLVLGFDAQNANNLMTQCQMEQQLKDNKEVFNALKISFYRGLISSQDTRTQLETMYPNVGFVNRTMNRWNLLRGVRYKLASARQNVQAYSKGLITRNEVIFRLQNLQYEPSSISLMLGVADHALNESRLKLLQKQVKQQEMYLKKQQQEGIKQAKLQAKNIKAKESNIEKFNNKRIRKIIKASSDKNILDWYKKEFIELWEVFYRLYYKDYNIADAMKWVKSKLPDLTDEELNRAEIQAAKVYRSEPNPPLM